MGTQWGVNRAVAQIHALLYILGRPMPADEIVDTLGVARSIANTPNFSYIQVFVHDKKTKPKIGRAHV